MRGLFAALALLISAALPAQAQTPYFAGGPTAYNCPMYDTTMLSEGTGAVLSECTVDTGPYSTAFIVASGEVTCDPHAIGNVILNAQFGPHLVGYDELGAHIVGSITGGVMTVTSMVTPFPSYRIGIGQLLNDAFGGTRIPTDLSGIKGSKLTVTAQLTSTQAGGLLGGTGTYSVSSGAVTVPSQDMWSLNVGVSLGGLPSALQISRGPLEPFFCQNGSRQIVTFAGYIDSLDAGLPFVTARITLLFGSAQHGSNEIQSASWQNGTLTIFSLNFTGGALNGFSGAN